MSRSLTLLKSLFSSRNPSLRQLPGLSPIFPFSKWSTLRAEASRIHTSSIVEGLEEFFPKTDDIIEEGERAGHSWSANELRQKSNEDLHKLWYVLLKERNMLLTLENEANRNNYHIPAPERKHKVIKSMARLKFVLHERSMAVQEAKKELGLISNEEFQIKPDTFKKKTNYLRRKKISELKAKSELTA